MGNNGEDFPWNTASGNRLLKRLRAIGTHKEKESNILPAA